jgi:hypothetical protein
MRGIPDDRWKGLSDDPFDTGLENREEDFPGFVDGKYNAFWTFHNAMMGASVDGDLASVQSLMARSGADIAARFAQSFDKYVRRGCLSSACEHGHLDLLAYWLEDSSLMPPLRVNDYVIDYGRPEDCREEGVAAPLLWVAAAHGQYDLAQALLVRGADPEAPASDGSTPFYVACEQGHTPVLRLLSRQKVDMHSLNQDGTSPIYAAAMNGHLEVVQFLHTSGCDVQTRGTIHLWSEERGEYLLTGVTLHRIAQDFGHTQLLQWLESLAQPVVEARKRERSSMSPLERAQLAGVADMLKPIPPVLHVRIASGSEEDAAAAKKELHKLQKYNSQVISRAEAKKLKQTTLSF